MIRSAIYLQNLSVLALYSYPSGFKTGMMCLDKNTGAGPAIFNKEQRYKKYLTSLFQSEQVWHSPQLL